ncbi:hypothetical protein E2C01_074517 [Portunus trituberculatus]|uniref:Uncharacterized protein n=1 Tax=Portunus trituberculatus TaxID=210409 RepID=A0A5B7IEH8_PORTR|nr:hypothetical protein [Portunus trituberculatus]
MISFPPRSCHRQPRQQRVLAQEASRQLAVPAAGRSKAGLLVAGRVGGTKGRRTTFPGTMSCVPVRSSP